MRSGAAILSVSVFFLLVSLFLPSLVNAQGRPKIALVLGGGGARGAAHVGVLKVLEANHVPVDFIVGTSMGSIVGGMYAAGYSPEEIEQLFKDIDWNELLSDRPSEDSLPFRNKKDFQRLSNLEMGFNKGKLSFPRGIISGQKLDFMLAKLTIHTVEAQSFDELRIPFRAVATDAVTGEMVVFDKGSLAEAIRASMSVPGAFPPVKMDNKLLVDGFLSKNVPVEVAKAWGADIIITVNVDAPLKKEEELNNLLDLSGQMFAILSKKNVDESLALLTDKDILIHPELKGVGPGDFVKTPVAAKMGEEEALKHVDSIKRYSVSDRDFQAYLAHQRVRDRNPIMIDEIRVTKPKRVNEQIIRGRTVTRAGQKLDFDQLERDLTNIYAIGDFETVGFDVKKEEDKNILLVNTREKSWGPEYLRFGFNTQGDTQGINNHTLLLDYRHTQLNRLGGEWKLVGALGQNTGLGTEFYQPLDEENYFFVAPNLTYNINHQMIYDGEGRKTSDYRTTEAGGGIDLGVNLKTYLEARIGLRSYEVSGKPDIGDPDLPEFDHVNKTGMLGQLNFDQLDDHRFPTKGLKVTSRFFMSDEKSGSDEGYEKLDVTLTKATTFAERHTFIAAMQGGISPDNDVPYYDKFTTGGFLRLSGLGEGQLRGKNMGVADLVYLYKLVDTKGFANKIYLGSSFETGNVWEDNDDFGEDLIYSGSLFIGVDTILGPLYIGYGKAESNDERGFIYLGKIF